MNREDVGRGLRKVLFVGDTSPPLDLVPTFVRSMGCQCLVASNEEQALSFIEREAFDAILLGLRHWECSTKNLMLKLTRTRAGLWGRILAIRAIAGEVENLEFIEYKGLPQDLHRDVVLVLSQGALLHHIWTSLQEVFSFPQWRGSAPHGERDAPIVFDSFNQLLPAGVRSMHQSVRQLVCQYKSMVIDLLIDPLRGSGRVSLTGQVLDAATPMSKIEGIALILTAGGKKRSTVKTNQFGEFSFEFDLSEDLGLAMETDEGAEVLIPLGDMTWIKKRLQL